MLQPEVLASMKSTITDSASDFIPLPEKVVFGYWPNVPNPIGYAAAHATTLALNEFPLVYNVVAVAFMSGEGIPTFTSDRWTNEEFRAQVAELNTQGSPVLLSLGGVNGHIALIAGEEDALAYEIIRLVETHGFDGFDINLEPTAIGAANNNTVIPAALRMVKDHYASEDKYFIISITTEFPYLTSAGPYQSYIDGLEGYYDLITPQYYNQKGEGLWVPEMHKWVTQNDDRVKEEFLFYLTDSFVHGTRGYQHIPASKLVIGLPANADATNSDYVVDPDFFFNTLNSLEAQGMPVRGIMTGPGDWDNKTDKEGVPHDREFIERYARIANAGDKEDSGNDKEPNSGNKPGKPTAPANLTSGARTQNSITLNWEASTGDNALSSYTVYRNNIEIGKTVSPGFTDTGLTADTQYAYRIVAVDTADITSDSSATLYVSTTFSAVAYPDWSENTGYTDGDVVSYSEKAWRCVMPHTSNQYWTPDNASSLWEAVN